MTMHRRADGHFDKTRRGIDMALLAATLVAGALLTALLLYAGAVQARVPARAADTARPAATGFLVLAPDRGFTGNEEIREAFETFAAGRNAALAVVTDERTRGNLAQAFEELVRRGARRVVVLPLFVSGADPRLALARQLLAPAAGVAPLPVAFTPPFGESYLAVELLADRLRAIAAPAGKRLVVVGDGARTAEERTQMQADYQRLAARAAQDFGFAQVEALVMYPRPPFTDDPRRADSERALAAAADAPGTVIVPFHLGRKLDRMMSFNQELKRLLPPDAALVDADPAPDPLVGLWLARAANRALPLAAADLGVVLLAHGSDYHWNETLRQAVAPLAARYKIESVFSMADPPTLERAVRRLERRGARAIVIVRVFGLADSFERDVERLFGLDIEAPRAAAPEAVQAHDSHDHGHGHGAGTTARIRTAALVQSRGGMEDHPLFAQALLARATALSKDPARETVILTAHGARDDARNARWLELLESLARQMRAQGGQKFRAIRVATWREDWPGKREPWIAKVREMVQEAARAGGRALVIPARTTGVGPEREFLAGLDYALGEGFAPHPLFARWFEEQVRVGVAVLAREAL